MGSGEIKSPNYPNNYDNNLECIWIITVPVGNVVELSFKGSYNVSTKVSFVLCWQLTSILCHDL